MDQRDQLYARLLHLGFIVLQQAIDSGNQEWVRAEVEWLHNVPSLLGEENVLRHRYFWEQERRHYLDWIEEHGTAEAKSRLRTYYAPILDELEPLVIPSGSGNGGNAAALASFRNR